MISQFYAAWPSALDLRGERWPPAERGGGAEAESDCNDRYFQYWLFFQLIIKSVVSKNAFEEFTACFVRPKGQKTRLVLQVFT